MPERSDGADAGGIASGVSHSLPANRDATGDAAEAAGHPLAPRLWRVAVAEDSMTPALAPGDWLLLDPTARAWPRRGSIVVFHVPFSGLLAIKRVAARGGDRVRIPAGVLHLAPDQVWLLGDNTAISVDSRRYGPVALDAFVGRAWFRYAPAGRIGPVRGIGTRIDPRP